MVKGPGSALFGFNAASGVINIVTVNPLHTKAVTMVVEAGNASALRATAVAAFPVAPGIGLRLSAGYEAFDEFDNVAGLISRNVIDLDPSVRKELAGDLHVALDGATEAVFGFTRSHNERLEFIAVLAATASNYDTASVSACMTHDTNWGTLTAHVYHNSSNIDYTFTIAGDKVVFDNDTMVGSLSGLFRLPAAGVIRLGAEYRHNKLRATPGYPGATAYDVAAGSVMWETALGNRTVLTLAGRVDHLVLEQLGQIDSLIIYTSDDFDRNLTEWSANSSLLFTIDPFSSVRVAVGRGVQAPSLANFGFRLAVEIPRYPVPLVAAGDPATKAARVDSVEIGYRKSFEALAVNLDLAGFYNRTTQAIVFPAVSSPPRATPPAVPFVLVTGGNLGGYESYGVEASLDGRLGERWRWLLNYTWLRTDDAIPGNENGIFRPPLAFDAQTPEHKANAQLSYRSGP